VKKKEKKRERERERDKEQEESKCFMCTRKVAKLVEVL
jgi:hypothetical protein